MDELRLTPQISPPKLLADGLWHNRVRFVDQDGQQHGTTLKFSCPRPQGLPSTVNDGITRLRYMLYNGAKGMLLEGPFELPMAILAGIVEAMEASVEDMPEWFTGPPVWTDFPEAPHASAPASGPQGSDSLYIRIP